MDRLGHILPAALGKRGLAGHAGAALVTFRAQKWLEERIPDMAVYVKASKLQDETLIIQAHNAVAAQECQPLLPDLLAFIQKECPGQRLVDIRLIRA
jgi:hypothetical protein